MDPASQQRAREILVRVIELTGGNAAALARSIGLKPSVLTARRSGIRAFSREAVILYALMVELYSCFDDLRRLLDELPPEYPAVDQISELIQPDALRELFERSRDVALGRETIPSIGEYLERSRVETVARLEALRRVQAEVAVEESPFLIEGSERLEPTILFVPVSLNRPSDGELHLPGLGSAKDELEGFEGEASEAINDPDRAS